MKTRKFGSKSVKIRLIRIKALASLENEIERAVESFDPATHSWVPTPKLSIPGYIYSVGLEHVSGARTYFYFELIESAKKRKGTDVDEEDAVNDT